MEFKEINIGQKVWTMIGNYPYEVEVVSLDPCPIQPPMGTYQYDSIKVWRKESDTETVHTRKTHQVFKSKEAIKNYLFPKVEPTVKESLTVQK